MTWEIRNMIEDIIAQIINYVIFLLGQNLHVSVGHFKHEVKKDLFHKVLPRMQGGTSIDIPWASVNPDWQAALFWHWECLSQAFWKRKNTKII